MDEMLRDVHAEAQELRNFTIAFLALLVYVSLIISSTTHEQILRVAPIKLPLFDVAIPLVRFYQFMPAALLFMHLYLLVQHYLFSQQAFQFESVLKEQVPQVRARLQRKLGNLPFLHSLLGRHSAFMNLLMALITSIALIVWPLWTLVWMQMVFLPYHDQFTVDLQRFWLTADVLLVVYFWSKILDRKDDWIPWWHWRQWAELFYGAADYLRTEIAAHRQRLDLFRSAVRRLKPDDQPLAPRAWALAWWSSGIESLRQGRYWNRQVLRSGRRFADGFARWALCIGMAVVLSHSWLVSTLPDSPEERWLIEFFQHESYASALVANGLQWASVCPESGPDEDQRSVPACLAALDFDFRGKPTRLAFAPTAWLHEQRRIEGMSDFQALDYEVGRLRDCAERSPLSETETPGKLDGEDDGHDCRLVDGWIPRNLIVRERLLADFSDGQSDTEATATASPNPPGKPIRVSGLNLQRRRFDYADFTLSRFPDADLRQAVLDRARLTQASLENARLQGARLVGSDLRWAVLKGANLSRAKLAGAHLASANLAGANLSGAGLAVANLLRAKLPGVNLSKAKLSGASLAGADLAGADLSGASLLGADLSGANFTAADLSRAKLVGVKLAMTGFEGANLSFANLAGADLAGGRFAGGILVGLNIGAGIDDTRKREFTSALRADLAAALDSGSEAGKRVLESRMEDFSDRLAQSAKPIPPPAGGAPCLAGSHEPASSVGCAGDVAARERAIRYWVSLACDDQTEGRWVASALFARARNRPTLLGIGGLAAALKSATAAAVKTPKICPGLANRPQPWKQGNVVKDTEALQPSPASR